MNEKCGVFGIWSDKKEVFVDTYFALLQMQHRGQESAGIVSASNGKLFSRLGMGTVDQVFWEEIPEEKLVKSIIELYNRREPQANIVAFLKENKTILKENVLEKLKGNVAIGHVRYSTTGASMVANIQPMIGWFYGKQFALGHNGNLIRTQQLREECKRKGYQFKTTTDTEVIVALLTTSPKTDFIEALLDILPRLEGAFSLTILFEDMIIGVRDSFGIRPLCWGVRDRTFMVASESCVLDVLGAELIDDVHPGEIIIFQGGKERKIAWAVSPSLRGLCLFEYIYFARPDSIMEGVTLYKARETMGRYLAEEHPVPIAQLVVSVPDAANPAAFGFGIESKLPVTTYGLFRAHTVGRTFIEPAAERRKVFQRLKFNPIPAIVKSLRIVLVDDSIVRGTALPRVIRFLMKAGVAGIDIRISSPPIRYPCYLGIDIPTYQELVRVSNPTDAEMLSFLRRETGFQGDLTLGHLSLEGTIRATGFCRENFCTGCFNKSYPIPPD
ncbi:MAG: amidophosphoribosyltransferase [Candidatus Nealsonbacteria bacterium CG_4_9_14_0_2_um_filter_37_38]|uniref:Amidophosphoribosyltransferase n=1 Tax=Candidatus Nealsonbacteria bacterium CG_4_10_14_0_8_um_filter_37_14 TaxID=1974684 RepID=A0A2M7R6G9_9BACT|nr:MAG: amidophosphoribosyltransferase [Candidatus Nealsonbacteria bacterium CG11_big_fil_rev_8_21_14_0_20_37_68]PIW92066.1 MAG: amidophosphoribosyltransferase [Candidatus Nealsonbacteria bacterium CG_4_8_14_3_um_filter_37_23]PIY88907.1 MAG: amidophosphoribosyltransferase [Candidatus Nealsonbacteria bacterium CG_4_10_14_0_8_um_filter_37_14]PJC51576.1 MAG: amidophosphoribosyltransferase [Candidatus Nealsonbacteria bacterium CG_4_9_14_0_2_um_filter_37_38]